MIRSGPALLRPVEGGSMVGVRRRCALVLCLVAGLVTAGAAPGSAGTQVHDGVVSDNPANSTPHVLDGAVKAVVQVGDTMIVGGQFSQVQGARDGDPVLSRPNIFAFDAATGAISSTFAPPVDGEVTSLAVAADGQSVYVGGVFNRVNNTSTRKLARLSVATGAKVAGFRPGPISAKVNDLALTNGRLLIAGQFQTVNNVSRPILASLNPATGALTDAVTVPFTGVHNGGTTAIVKFAVDPAGNRLVAIGNFTAVGGQDRRQVAMLDISGPTATVANWRTTLFTSTCHPVFDTYLRDLDISPDGSYVVISTTGAYRGAESGCDVIARFEMGATGLDVRATWRNYTGGDTTYAVAITGSVVYVGGHFRWVNNPFAGDRAGAGAVPREGIAALDPVNGMPLSWNPGRNRGVGVFDLLATPAGLWVGSDTDRLANELHGRIAFLPLVGGSALPANRTGTLPNDVYLLGSSEAGAADQVRRQFWTGVGPPSATVSSAGTETWGQARGAFLVDQTLYTGWSNGTLTARSFDGTAYGSPSTVNLYAATFASDLPNVTGMFFDDGRLYYTLNNVARLYYRYFTPESRVVGAVRYEATGDQTAMSRVAGMFLSGSTIYLADRTTGRLDAVSFTDGVITGPAVVADASIDWRARGAFLWSEPPPPPNEPPNADFTTICTFLHCTLDGSASEDEDGTVAAYAWDFGDGETLETSGPTTAHTFAAGGTYLLGLRVTDNEGAVSSLVTHQVTVAPQPTSTIAFRSGATASSGAATQRVTVPASVQAGDALLLFVSNNNDLAVTTHPAGWTLAETRAGTEIRTRLYTRVATAADAGAQTGITFGGATKGDLTLLAYSGVDPAPFAAVASAAETVARAAHSTPSVDVPADGSWVVSYWADKSSTTSTWTDPAGQTRRATSVGTGTGHVSSVATDYAGAAAAGPSPSLTAVADSASAKATTWSVVLRGLS